MPKANVVVTESAPKLKQRALYVSVGILLMLILFALPFLYERYTSAKCAILLSGKCLSLEVASDQQTREKGLSGHKNMSTYTGMLFVFETPGQHCIWMKDMKFPLDIVWLNEDKQIEHIEENVAPETYPKTFCPSENAKYVIELNKGIVGQANLHIGQQLNL